MKKLRSFFCSLLLLGVLVFTIACAYNPQDVTGFNMETNVNNSVVVENSPNLSLAAATGDTASLNKLDLYFCVGPAVTGTIKIEVRNSNGTVTLWSGEVSAASLVSGTGWKSFSVPSLNVIRNEKFRIYITRSNAHNYSSGDYIVFLNQFWLFNFTFYVENLIKKH